MISERIDNNWYMTTVDQMNSWPGKNILDGGCFGKTTLGIRTASSIGCSGLAIVSRFPFKDVNSELRQDRTY